MGGPPMDLCYSLGTDLARVAGQPAVLALGVIAGLLLARMSRDRALVAFWIWGMLVVLLSQIQLGRYLGSPRIGEASQNALKAWVDHIPPPKSLGPIQLEMSYLLAIYVIGFVPAILFGFGLGKLMKLPHMMPD